MPVPVPVPGLPATCKRRYYSSARGSATESAALLDVCRRLELLEEAKHVSGKAMLVRVVAMLIRLAQACEP